MSSKTCSSCVHAAQERVLIWGSYAPLCKLTNEIKNVNTADACSYYNKDITNDRICFNCENFLGGGDWGLSCKNHYMRITCGVSKACSEFKKTQSSNS